MKSLSVDSPRPFPFHSCSSFEERTFPPYLLPMEEDVDVFSASLPSFGFSFITSLLSCVAVCTGPEDATEITMCCLAAVRLCRVCPIDASKLCLEFAVIFL
ncbi:hypothetical protein HID58_004025 [Brassica napus]|uniref:Uncharacterized protein n=1 Tax=Brassica napus TaxID=3708 RepID=A0ABQ7XI42_BRANA|nr:hypothetical protein HID58_004025 [Brassica napus]